jgi:hypothetical protein
MADPRLKDVLAAIAELRAETKSDLATLRSDLAKLDAKMTKRFDDLDEELTRHTAVDREIEKDMDLPRPSGRAPPPAPCTRA